MEVVRKIAIVTNVRAPYRVWQFSEFNKISNCPLNIYYTNKKNHHGNYEQIKNMNLNEKMLSGHRLGRTLGYINFGLIKIVRENDVIIIGGYQQLTYIILILLCKIYNKKSVLIFDGISTERLIDQENKIKKSIKNYVVKKVDYILGNGTISKEYFNKIFNYPKEKIYNQYLTVDTKTIDKLYINKNKYRKEYRKKYNILETTKVLIYSGRLVRLKNIASVIRAISRTNNREIVLFIVGGGVLEEWIGSLSRELNVNCIITGYIEKQEEVFKHYFIGDAFILPSVNEVWGLVVNEAMSAGLPVLVSKVCGCSLDLVKENGYIINPYSINDIKKKIEKLFYDSDLENMGYESRKIIKDWTFENSRRQLEYIIDDIRSN